MSLIDCPECGKQASSQAPACPSCGHPITGPAPTVVSSPTQHQVVNVQVAQPAQRRWNAGVAALLSFLIPGLGQLYKGQVINGVVWFVVVIIGYVAFIIPGVVLHLCCIIGAATGNPYK